MQFTVQPVAGEAARRHGARSDGAVPIATEIETPVGRMRLTGDGDALLAIDWCGRAPAPGCPVGPPDALLAEAARQLRAYFEGRLRRFDLPLAPAVTPFRRRVLSAMAEIPYGATSTYGALARQLGTAARAVGGACRNNPIPIVLPCHRVVASDAGFAGGLGGFGGVREGPWLDTKRRLLDHERRWAGQDGAPGATP